MIWFIISEYFQDEKEYAKHSRKGVTRLQKLYIAICIITTLCYIGGIIYNSANSKNPVITNAILMIIYSIIIGMTTFIFLRCANKNKNLKDGKVVYMHKINILRNILKDKDCYLYSKEKIEELLRICDKILSDYEQSDSLLAPLKYVFSTMITPILAFALGSILNVLEFEESIYFAILLIAVLVQLLGIYYFLAPIIRNFYDKQKQKVEQIKRLISNIRILDFLE